MPLTLRGASALLMSSQDEEVLLVGPAGTSKTIGGCQKILDHCARYPGSRHLLCRQTRKSMTDTTLVSLESVIGKNHPEVTRIGREQRHSYRLFGSEIVCAGLDEPSKAFGSAYMLVVVEEAIEISFAAWELFARAMRDPELRRDGEVSGIPYHQLIAITNPDYPNHWLNQRATPYTYSPIITYRDWYKLYQYNKGPQSGKIRRLVSVHQDNPTLFNTESWKWTEEGNRYITKRLAGMTGHNRARMLEGRWVAAEGGVFPEFSDAHIVPNFEPPEDWSWYVAYDPGYDHPTAVVWFVVAPNGDIYIADEIYKGGRSVAEHCAEIHRKNEHRTIRKYLGDPQEMFSQRSQGPSCASQAKLCGITFVGWPATGRNSQAMVNGVRELLNHTVNGEPVKLYVMASCVNSIMEFQSWRYKRAADGSLPAGDDAFEDRDNHVIDCVKGVVSARCLKYWGKDSAGVRIVG